MGIEIERKYLVDGVGWKNSDPLHIRQGYLNTDKLRTVRVRTVGADAYLTIKGQTNGISRAEFEYPIPLQDAQSLLHLCSDSIVEKMRYVLPIDNVVWEIDEFYGANEGLLIAEVELRSESQSITLPQWVGKEVSDDARYYNSMLAQAPFSSW